LIYGREVFLVVLVGRKVAGGDDGDQHRWRWLDGKRIARDTRLERTIGGRTMRTLLGHRFRVI
jgi:hypothetical protein